MAFLPQSSNTSPLGADYAASALQSTITALTVPAHRRGIAHLAAPLVPAMFAIVREAANPVTGAESEEAKRSAAEGTEKRLPGQRNFWNVALPIGFGLLGLGALAVTTYGVRRRPTD